MSKPSKPVSPAQAVDVKVFLDTIFRNRKADQGVVGLSHPGQGKGWPRWRYDPKRLPESNSLYYFPSTIRIDNPRASRITARADQFDMCFCIVLDDIGTKITKHVPLEPSYRLETSKGSWQYGYILKYPVAMDDANALVRALVTAGFTDAGRSNGAGHLMRVPGSHNVKTTPAFVAKLGSWRPDIVYSHNEIALGFGVTPDNAPPVKLGELAVLKPGEIDPLYDWLLAHDRLLAAPDIRGWMPVICPWEDAHTPGKPGGTDYKPSAGGGVWRCLHEHCARRTMADFKAWVVEQDPKADIGILSRSVIDGAVAALRKALPPAVIEEVERKAHLHKLDADASPIRHLAQQIRMIPLSAGMLPDYDRTAKDTPTQSQTTTTERVAHVLDIIGVKLRHNAMTRTTEIKCNGYTSINDAANAGMDLIVHACARCGMKNENAIYNAVSNLSKNNSFHPTEEWMTSIPWDGTDRIGVLTETLILEDPKLAPWRSIALRRWLIQTATAIRNHKRRGEQIKTVGYVLTLQGEQAIGKSRWVESLMPLGFVQVGLSLRLGHGERDTVDRSTGRPIGELGELDYSIKHADIAGIKNFLTTPVDKYRPAYGRITIESPRCTTFIATVNPKGFLMDQTGNRRFWPLAVVRCRFDHGIDMQQLWAQVAVLEAKGEQFWLTASEEKLAQEVVKAHMAPTEVKEIMDNLLYLREQNPEGPDVKYEHATAKKISARYNIPFRIVTSSDLISALRREGFRWAKVRGDEGFYIPPSQGYLGLSAAQRESANIIGFADRTKNGGKGGKGG